GKDGGCRNRVRSTLTRTILADHRLTYRRRPPALATSRGPGSALTALRSAPRPVTSHTRAPPAQASARRARSQKRSRLSGCVAPNPSTLRRPSRITGRRPEYHSSAPEFSSGPSWTTTSAGAARRASSSAMGFTERAVATTSRPSATHGTTATSVSAVTAAAAAGESQRADRPERAGDPRRLDRIAPRAPPRQPDHGGARGEHPRRGAEHGHDEECERREGHVLVRKPSRAGHVEDVVVDERVPGEARRRDRDRGVPGEAHD